MKKTDAELLAIYAKSGDESAFAEVVSRHASMVYRVCSRLLGGTHDAGDCSQAVFLVLARKAGSLKRKGDVSAWLYRVSQYVTLKAIRARTTRAQREKEAAELTAFMAEEKDATLDQGGVLENLYRELNTLSSVLRQAVILRYIEGHSERDAATIAACPVGTLSRRASDGLAQLRKKMSHRGAPVTATGLVGFFAADCQHAVPETLLSSILDAVRARTAGGNADVLARSTLSTMMWMKIGLISAIAAAAAVVAAGGVLWNMAGDPPHAEGDGPAESRLNPRIMAMEDNTWLNLKPARTPKGRTYSGNCFGGGKFYYFGGGHFSYHKNDVELYDPATNVWTRVTEPELPEGAYSDWVRTASQRAAPSGAPYLGGHTYQYTSWDPVRKRFFLPYRQCGVWEFDPEKAKWENIFSVFADPKPRTPHDMGPGTMAGIHSAFEPGLGKPVMVITHKATGLYVFDYEKKDWVKHKPLPKGLGTELYSTYVDEWKAHLFANNGWRKGKTHFTKVDLVAGTSKLIESPKEIGICMALSYDRANKVVVVMPRVKLSEKGGTVSVWALDVDTLKWTELKQAGPRPKGHSTGKWAPLWYDPDHNVHLFLNSVNRGAKFKGGKTETWCYRYKKIR